MKQKQLPFSVQLSETRTAWIFRTKFVAGEKPLFDTNPIWIEALYLKVKQLSAILACYVYHKIGINENLDKTFFYKIYS